MMGAVIASTCSLLLTGDYGYLELIPGQIEALVKMGKVREDGHLLIPTRITEKGWTEYKTLWVRELAHLYHASMAPGDRDLFNRLYKGDKESNWREIRPEPDRRSGNSERARFLYYEGKNADWSVTILSSEYEQVLKQFELMVNDPRSTAEIARDSRWPANPCVVKGLTQVTMGAPQTIYNGGLNRATVRYFDADRARPGLPPDVAALVDSLGRDHVGVHLANTSRTETHRLIIQAGAFREHEFTQVGVGDPGLGAGSSLPPRGRDTERGSSPPLQVNSKHFEVVLPPSASIRINAGLKRFSNKPSYAFPWHGDKAPVI